MQNIAVLTSARSEYGLLKPLLALIAEDKDLNLQLIVTGSHLWPDYGNTYKEIEDDGFEIIEKIDIDSKTATTSDISRAMGQCLEGVSQALERLNPGCLVILGDRYELLPVCSAALIANIKIAHIAGGDITEGAIDDKVRNAVSQLADWHFPGSIIAQEKLKRMGIPETNMHMVGETNVDSILSIERISRRDLAIQLDLNDRYDWIMVAYHPETRAERQLNIETMKNIFDVLLTLESINIIVTRPNSDFGSDDLVKIIHEYSSRFKKIKFFASLGQERYISLLFQCQCIIGNSSSIVFDSPSVPLSAILVGDRQKGRLLHENIIHIPHDKSQLIEALKIATSEKFKIRTRSVKSQFGDGYASMRIKEALKTALETL